MNGMVVFILIGIISAINLIILETMANMVMKMNEEKKFWEYVGKMGYPTSEKGVKYGSKEKEELDELRWFFYIRREHYAGKQIGWIAGSHMSGLASKYWDANLAFIRVMEGEDDVVRKMSAIIREHAKTVEMYAKGIIENEVIDWVNRGGLVDMDGIVKSLKCLHSEENEFKRMHESYEKFFGEAMKSRIMHVLEVLEISEQGIEEVKKNFEMWKERVRDLVMDAERELKKLAEKAGIDYEQLRQKLL